MPKKTTEVISVHSVNDICVRYIKVDTFDMIGSEVVDDACFKGDDGICHFLTTVEYEQVHHKEPIGCIGLFEVGSSYVLGWSLCAKDDKFSYKIARELARKRAEKRVGGSYNNYLVLTDEEIHKFPREVRGDVIVMISDIMYEFNRERLRK